MPMIMLRKSVVKFFTTFFHLYQDIEAPIATIVNNIGDKTIAPIITEELFILNPKEHIAAAAIVNKIKSKSNCVQITSFLIRFL